MMFLKSLHICNPVDELVHPFIRCTFLNQTVIVTLHKSPLTLKSTDRELLDSYHLFFRRVFLKTTSNHLP